MKKNHAIVFVLRFSALGDVAMTLPVVYSVAAANTAMHFRYYTQSRLTEMFVNPPRNLEIVGLDSIKPGDVFRFLVQDIRKYRPSRIADLHNVSRTWGVDIYAMVRGISVGIVDKKRFSRRPALKKKTVQSGFVERYFHAFEQLGLNVECAKRFFLKEEIQSPIKVERPAVGIAPFARYVTKQYPFELMGKVVEGLVSRKVNVYLFGGGERERELLEQFERKYSRCVSLVGKYSLKEEMGIMADLDVILSMDSANQHLGSLVGTKVLTIWGGTTPSCGFTAYGQSKENAIVAGVGCQPCSIAGSKKCRLDTMECMRVISPSVIVERIINELNEYEGN